MRLSETGIGGRCSFCAGQIEGTPGGKDEEARPHLGAHVKTGTNPGAGVYLCCRPGCVAAVGELLADAIRDSALLKDHEGKHTRALNLDETLNSVIARCRAVAGGGR